MTPTVRCIPLLALAAALAAWGLTMPPDDMDLAADAAR